LELFEAQLLVFLETHSFEKLYQVDVLGIDDESDISHYFFHLVFELGVIFSVLFEKSAENWVLENLIPGDTVGFSHLEASFQEIDRVRGKFLIDLYRFILDISYQLKLGASRPWCLSMGHFVENES
jgi:hypothetical protein